MNLKEKIDVDMKSAMKSKDAERLSVLRMVKAKLLNEEKSGGEDLTDEQVISTLNTLVKQRRDSASQYADAGRSELAEKELAEISVLQDYLPKQANQEQIAKAVAEAISETGATSMKDMGNVMKTTRAKLSKFTVDGKEVSEIVKANLA